MKGGFGCEMDNVEKLATIDWWYVIIAILLLLVCVKFVWSLLDWLFIEKLGIETRKMKQRRQESELLKTTAELAKKTADNLNKLQQRHIQDEEEFRNNLNNYIKESREDRKALHKEMQVYSDNRINDRRQSLAIQKELTDYQNKLTDKVDDICQKLIDMEEKENKRVQSEIKERIAQLYRQCSETKQISSMELEALEDLIETYEAHGGENSFVHSVVQKEMYTWEVK